MAGHVRFELRNVVANYPFEKSRRFAVIQPNFGHGDHSRLSCSAGHTQPGLGSAGNLQQARLMTPMYGPAVRCGRASNPIPAVPDGTPQCGLVLPDRPQLSS